MDAYLFFTSEKYCKNYDANECADAVGEEVETVADASGDKVFLHDFGDAAVCDADDRCQQQGPPAVGLSVGGILLPITPKAGKGEEAVHKEMYHLVGTDDGLDMGQTRTRKSSQNQDDDSAQDSRVTISCESVQTGVAYLILASYAAASMRPSRSATLFTLILMIQASP